MPTTNNSSLGYLLNTINTVKDDPNTYYANTQSISNSLIPNPERYPVYFGGGVDIEDIYGRNQGFWNKMGHGVTKALNTAGTTAIEGTLGLINGAYQAISNQNLSSFYDNDFNKGINNWNNYLNDKFANYYTTEEANAAWYSPSRWATANWFSDKFLNGLGFAAGAYLSGAAWGKALSLVGKFAGAASEGATVEEVIAAKNQAEAQRLLTRDPNQFSSLEEALNTVSRNNVRSAALTQKAKAWGMNFVRSSTAASGEAQLEAFQAKNDYKNQLIQEYKDTHGTDPEGEALAKIDSITGKVGNGTFYANMVLLTLSNFYQFPKILGKGWHPDVESVLGAEERNIGRTVLKDAEGNIIKREGIFGSKLTPDVAKGEKLASSNATTWLGEQLNRTKVGKFVNKVAPFGHVIFSPNEAFEELSQTFIPDYFKNLYDLNSDTKNNWTKSFTKTLSQELDSNDFWESGLLGGVTGGLMEIRSNFREIGEHRNTLQRTQEMVNKINESPFSNYTEQLAQSVGRDTLLDDKAKQAVLNGDKLDYEDVKTDTLLNYVLPRIQYGRSDLLQQDLNNWKKTILSNDGSFEELQKNKLIPDNISKEDFVANIDHSLHTVETMTNRFEDLNIRYGKLRNEDGTSKYNKETLARMAYSSAKIDDYNGRIGDLTSQLNTIGIDPSPVLGFFTETPENSTELPEDQRQMADQRLKDFTDHVTRQLNSLNYNTTEQQNIHDIIGDLVELTARRKYRLDEYEGLVNHGDAFNDTASDEEPSPEDGGDEGVITSPEDTKTPKQRFFEENTGKDFTFNLGERGSEQGTLEYDAKNDVLAFKRPDDSLYEITNQDFKDGLIHRNDSNVQETTDPTEGSEITDNAFLAQDDPRTTLKRQETIRRITDFLNSKRQRVSEVQENIDKNQKILDDIKNKISSKLSSGETAASLNSVLKMQKGFEDEIQNLEAEKTELQEHIARYGEILAGNVNDYNTSLNEIEKQLAATNDLIRDMNKEQTRLNTLLDNAKRTVKKIAKMIADKANLKLKTNPSLVGWNIVKNAANQLTNSPLLTDWESKYDTLISALRDVKGDFNLSESQQRTIKESLDKIAQDLKEHQTYLTSLQKVYDELRQRAFDIQDPLKSEDFVSKPEAEEILNNPGTTNTDDDSDGIDDNPSIPKELYQGAKKVLSRLFRSTRGLNNERQGERAAFNKLMDTLSNRGLVSMTDRNKMKVILITLNNEKAAGLEGLTRYVSYNGVSKKYFFDTNTEDGRKKALHPQDGSVFAVVVKEESDGKRYFVDKNGVTLSEVGTSINLSRVVGSHMPAATLKWKNGENAFSKPESVSVTPEELRNRYESLRAQILSRTDASQAYSFNISSGNFIGDFKKSPIGTYVAVEDANTPDTVKIVKNGQTFRTKNGDTFKATKGTQFLLQTEDGTIPLSRIIFKGKLLKNVLSAIQYYGQKSGQTGYNENVIKYINFILPFQFTIKNDKLFRNSKEIADLSKFRFGTPSEINDVKESISLALDKARPRISDNLQDSFIDIQFDDAGNITETPYQTYQNFALNNIFTTQEEAPSNKYLILKDFFQYDNQVEPDQAATEPQSTSNISNEESQQLSENNLENPKINSKFADPKQKSFVGSVEDNNSLVQNLLEAENIITTKDCD